MIYLVKTIISLNKLLISIWHSDMKMSKGNWKIKPMYLINCLRIHSNWKKWTRRSSSSQKLHKSSYPIKKPWFVALNSSFNHSTNTKIQKKKKNIQNSPIGLSLTHTLPFTDSISNEDPFVFFFFFSKLKKKVILVRDWQLGVYRSKHYNNCDRSSVFVGSPKYGVNSTTRRRLPEDGKLTSRFVRTKRLQRYRAKERGGF